MMMMRRVHKLNLSAHCALSSSSSSCCRDKQVSTALHSYTYTQIQVPWQGSYMQEHTLPVGTLGAHAAGTWTLTPPGDATGTPS